MTGHGTAKGTPDPARETGPYRGNGRPPGEKALQSGTDRRRLVRASAGLLLGLSFIFRFQMAFGVLGLLAWIVFKRPGSWRHVTSLAAWAGAVVAVGSAVDAWFYGGWVFTPWSYFRAQVLEGVASTFGTEPWYWYLAGLPLWMGPPLGIALVAALFLPLFSRSSSVWVWVAAAFFFGHVAVGHKELRFLFPLIYLAPVLLALTAESVAGWIAARSWARWTLGALVAQNVLLLLLLMTPLPHRATDLDGHFLRFLWQRADEAEGAPLFVRSQGPGAYQVWVPWDVSLEVYRHPAVRDVSYTVGTDIAGLVPEHTPSRRLLVLTRGDARPRLAGAEAARLVYKAEPGYMPLIRLAGLEDSAFEARLRSLSSWADPEEWQRRVWEVQLAGDPPGGGGVGNRR